MAATLNATLTNYLPGDILFYVAEGNVFTQDGLFNTAIQFVTDSPFVHVAIAVSAIQKIEAVGQGVLLDPINGASVAAAFHYSQKAQPFVEADLATALNWLSKQVGQLYGTVDILNAALLKIETAVVLNTAHYDCSALATEFLQTAGGIPAVVGLDPHAITPGGLATLLGVKVGQR